MNEIIYILINEAMPGYVKIGRTTDLEQRIRSLDTTGVPLPFECFYACTVENANDVEKKMHDAFLDSRVRSKREFFEISPERVASALKLAEIKDVTPKNDYVESQEDQQALDEARDRRSIFNFEMVGIPIGTELTFFNNEDIKVEVVDNRHIKIDERVTSLSAEAQEILSYKHRPQGTLYWMYEGETLDDRRRRMESEE